MVIPSQQQIAAGVKAGRKALNDYSAFDSGMVPDDALQTFVEKVAEAVLNAVPQKKG